MSTPTYLMTKRLRPYPGCHPRWTHAQRIAAHNTLDILIRAGFSPDLFDDENISPGADYEDFWEDALRLATTLNACYDREITLTTDDRALVLATREHRRFGPVSINEHLFGAHARDRFINDPVFLEHAGRSLIPAVLVLDGSPAEPGALNTDVDLVSYCLDRVPATAGETARLVLKHTSAKMGMWIINLDHTMNTREKISEYLFDLLDFTALHVEGRPGKLVIQDYLDLTFEMRHFVVDGQLITSAGCIEEFTPFDAIGPTGEVSPFDDRLRRLRGALGQAHMLDPDDYAVTSQPDIAARMREHAARIASQRGGTFVIDTAINPATDDVVAIEFNDLPNSGLYAANAWAIAEALVDAHDRGYDCGSPDLPPTT